MKRTLSILLSLLFICIATGASAGDSSLKEGEYKLLAYTIKNGDSALYSSDNSSNNISFHSLYISPEAMGTVLNNGSSLEAINSSSYQGFAIKAAYAPTSDITFHSSLGLTDTQEDTDTAYTDRVGWELDLGLAYRFLNNFAYEVHFGYMDTGELFKESNSYTDIDNITIVTNKLTMSF